MNYRQTGFIAFTGLLCLALAATVASAGGSVSGLLLVGLGLVATALAPMAMAVVGRAQDTGLVRGTVTVREK